MDTVNLTTFLTSLTSTVLEAGELAIAYQGTVVNLKKTVINHHQDSARIIAQREAKTEIDEKVQEMLLTCIQQTLGTHDVKIDAEEQTISAQLFQNNSAALTIVIDPIDGTLEYLNGSNEFSINVGLIEKGGVIFAIIYFPKLKKLYYLDTYKIPYEIIYDQTLTIKSRQKISSAPATQANRVYVNNRVNEKIIAALTEKGITVIKDDGIISWPMALLKCLQGEYVAGIFHTPHIRDVLLGALVENSPDGFMVNWANQKIIWPDGGRIPRVIFGRGKLSSEILSCLKIDS